MYSSKGCSIKHHTLPHRFRNIPLLLLKIDNYKYLLLPRNNEGVKEKTLWSRDLYLSTRWLPLNSKTQSWIEILGWIFKKVLKIKKQSICANQWNASPPPHIPLESQFNFNVLTITETEMIDHRDSIPK